jgi:hypothetical protein
MATAPVTPAPHVSWIKKLGMDIVKGFEALESPKGQAIVGAAEAVTMAIYPPSAPVVAIVNSWMQRAAVIEGKAQAAAELGVTATGPQKATAAIAAVAPDIEAIIQQYKLLPLTPAQMSAVNDAVIVIANALTPDPAASAPAAG